MNKRLVWMTALACELGADACELAHDFLHEISVEMYRPTPKPVRRRVRVRRPRVLTLPAER